jgi:hypothetical protein
MNKSCGKPITVSIPRGYSYREVQYKCGNTGIDGYPVLCDECEKSFDRDEYRVSCAENGENIDEDY